MPFDKQKAERVVKFVQSLRHVKGKWAGKPFSLQQWQIEKLLKPLFGTVNEDGTRQYRTAFVAIPRKNGKSMLAAALALYALFADGETGAEVYSAAAEREQASLVFNMAAQMVRMSPELNRRCKIIDSQKRIVYYEKNSFYRAISAEAYSKHGYSPTFVVYDELHCAPNRELWDTLVSGMGARTQPMMFAITTAGYDKNSICWEIWDYARKVRDGIIEDPTFFQLIYEAEENEPWNNEKTWKKANPNYGISIQPQFLEQEAYRAEQMPAYQNTFRRLYLNQWVTQETRWLSIDKWDACFGVPNFPEYEPCYLGLDLSSTIDITSASLFCPATGAVLNWSWIPEENMIERERRDKVPFSQWVRDGWIFATPGNVIDYGFIRKKINDLKQEYPGLRIVGYDPWNATQLAIQLEQEDGIPVIPIRQGYQTLSPACKELERRVLGGDLCHDGNPVLRWAMDNMVIQTDPNNNIRPVKNKATERIDPAVSLIIAIAAWQQAEEDHVSVYETRGVLAF